VYIFANILSSGCAHALVYAQFVHYRWRMRVGGFSWSMQGTCCWGGGSFLTRGKIEVLSIFSLFSTGVGVFVGVCVCIRTHTHTLHVGYSDVSPGVGTRLLESPKNPVGLNKNAFGRKIRRKSPLHIGMLFASTGKSAHT